MDELYHYLWRSFFWLAVFSVPLVPVLLYTDVDYMREIFRDVINSVKKSIDFPNHWFAGNKNKLIGVSGVRGLLMKRVDFWKKFFWGYFLFSFVPGADYAEFIYKKIKAGFSFEPVLLYAGLPYFSFVVVFLFFLYLSRSSGNRLVFICPNCLRSVFASKVSFECPFCSSKYINNTSALLIECPECNRVIPAIDCFHCNEQIDLISDYDLSELEKKTYAKV